MKLPLLLCLSLGGLFSVTAAAAQTNTWGSKSTLSSGPALSGSLPSTRSKSLSSGLPGNTLTTGGMYGTPAGSSQNSMLSHNHHVRFIQRHTDANNPLLHPQGSSATQGLMTPTLSPMSASSSSMSPMSAAGSLPK